MEGDNIVWRAKLLDWVSLIIITLLCISMFGYLIKFIAVDKIELFTIDSPLVYAVLVAVTILVCLIIVVYKEFKAIDKEKKADQSDQNGLFKELKNVAIFTVGIFVYIFLLKYMHFMLGTIVFLSIGMLLLNTTKDKMAMKVGKVVAAAVVTVPILYYVFYGIFNVMLP